MKLKTKQHCPRFTDKGPSVAERIIRTVRNLLKKPAFEKSNADWLSELPSAIKQYNNTIHQCIKMTPVEAKKKQVKKKCITMPKIEVIDVNQNIN